MMEADTDRPIHIKRNLLPSHLKPTCYAVKLEPNFDQGNFLGYVEISCVVFETTRCIQLHSKFIVITQAIVSCHGSNWDVHDSLSYDEANETIQLVTQEELGPESQIQITLTYTGKFTRGLTGLYQSRYETEVGTEHRLAATSMEPTYAREVFPCFDEPSIKAEFTISAVVDQSFTCVSNMPIDSTKSLPGSKKLVVFQKSLPMSTYLVALVSGPLAKVESTESGIPLSILCPVGSESEATFALDLAWKGLQLFESVFDLAYPLPKLDLVAVPDFSAGAMENWGIIMFRTTRLLLDPDDSALDTKQRITDMVLHEIAHMWFGNLVTMRYWDGLWLKEGFATLMSWYATDKIFPGWRIWDTYVAKTLQTALNLDALHSSHPVELIVQDATRAKQMFDDICYEKGCCALKMILDEMGEAKFFEGLKLYLRRHQFGNTESHDLWQSWEACTGDSIDTRMHFWTKETGFPVVKVTEQLGEQGQVQSYHLTQERFFASGPEKTKPDDPIFPLRIAIRSESGIEICDMSGRELVVPASGKGLFKLNVDHSGFFRTSYSPMGLKHLIDAACENRISLRDCIGLSCDLKALVASGTNRTSELLDFCLGMQQMDSYIMWEMIDGNLRAIRSVWKFHDERLKRALKKATVDLLGPKAHELGWDISNDEDEVLTSFKTSMFSGAGLAGDESIVSEARRLFANRVAGDESAIPASLRWEVFGIAAVHGGKDEIDALLNIWRTSSNEDEQYLALECLGRASDPELVKFVLSFAFTKDVKDQDLYYLLWLVGSSSHGAIELWEWAKENWGRVEQAVPVDVLCLVLGNILDGLHTSQQVKEVTDFFAARDTKEYCVSLQQRLESMKNRQLWAERDVHDVQTWLKTHGYLQV